FIIPFVLILAQPDFGSAIVYAVVLFGLMFMAKTNWKIILGVFGAVVAVLPLGWLMLADYQKNRLLSFVDPELDPTGAGYQVLRAKVVGSSGGLEGKGLFSADLLTQKTNYLPEEQTDFIFAATTEAVGFIGGMVIILLYGLLIYRLISLSMKAKDDFGAYLILGVSFMLLFHVVENIGMNIGAMPVTGIPLPLFSYGGSNLLTMMLAFGLVLNVNARRLRYTL
ncbi:MAG: FtsW/RodA/SpoVE family cell cycle protein, partial [Christensenellaceae bacterium]|nr:FtsW/RodA/SpoVE family cell cycle protein [Christensenellaceae bacterium]